MYLFIYFFQSCTLPARLQAAPNLIWGLSNPGFSLQPPPQHTPDPVYPRQGTRRNGVRFLSRAACVRTEGGQRRLAERRSQRCTLPGGVLARTGQPAANSGHPPYMSECTHNTGGGKKHFSHLRQIKTSWLKLLRNSSHMIDFMIILVLQPVVTLSTDAKSFPGKKKWWELGEGTDGDRSMCGTKSIPLGPPLCTFNGTEL